MPVCEWVKSQHHTWLHVIIPVCWLTLTAWKEEQQQQLKKQMDEMICGQLPRRISVGAGFFCWLFGIDKTQVAAVKRGLRL
jgi:hypothetical protein